ncbi:MAG: NAD(P)-dependent oxidoreductase [Rhizobiaceae bacterium]|nr:NAD(P)-dependent oxidoreductase [Rhizobiaceae bacterium]
MGRPMAARLSEAGYQVSGADPDERARETLSQIGVSAFAQASEAVAGANAVILMLPDGQIVRNVLLGSTGIAAGLPEGTLVIDMSSSAPGGTRVLGAELAECGLRFIDAPVSGGVARARTGDLCIMAGGEADDVAAAQPLLQAMGSTILHAGPLGCGHAAKALNNYVSAAGLVAACEAVIIGEQFGISGETLVDILNASTGRNNSTEVKLKPHILSGSFASGFAMALMTKDLQIAFDLARELGISACGAEQAVALWSAALAELDQGSDHTKIHSFLKERALTG